MKLTRILVVGAGVAMLAACGGNGSQNNNPMNAGSSIAPASTSMSNNGMYNNNGTMSGNNNAGRSSGMATPPAYSTTTPAYGSTSPAYSSTSPAYGSTSGMARPTTSNSTMMPPANTSTSGRD